MKFNYLCRVEKAKNTISFLLLCSYLLVLVHNIIPHVHIDTDHIHDAEHLKIEHHHHEHHHSHSHTDKAHNFFHSLADLFHSFCHVNTVEAHLTHVYANAKTTGVEPRLDNHSVLSSVLSIPLKSTGKGSDIIGSITASPHYFLNTAISLRAPPVFV